MVKIPSTEVLGIGDMRVFEDQTASPLASGNNAPVGSIYIGPGPIPWIKTGESATAWAQELMRAPYFNVKAFGAIGNGVANDKAAIQSTINAAAAAGGGVVFFPAGTYLVVVSGAVSQTQFTLTGAAGGEIFFLGCGGNSQIVMSGDGNNADRLLFRIAAGAKRVGFQHLRIASALINEHEQTHLIQFDNTGGAELETGRSFVMDCYMGHCRGDAIRTVGTGVNRVQNIIMKRIIFQMRATAPASRSCISIQRATDDVTIDLCYMAGASSIDMEPTGTGSITNFRITRNFCTRANVALSGNGLAEEHDNSICVGNTLTDGSILGGDINRLIVAENIIDFSPVAEGQNEGDIDFFERIKQLVIADNLCFRGGVDQSSISVVKVDNQGATGDNEGIACIGNMVIDERNALDNACIQLKADMNRANAQRNMCFLEIRAVGNGVAVLVEGSTADAKDNTIHENMGIGTNARLAQVFQTQDGNASICDNFGRNSSVGVRFTDPDERYFAGRNVLPQMAGGVIGLQAGVLYAAIDNSHSLVGPSTFMLVDDPEGNVPAGIGSIGLRSSGGGAGITLYVKEADNGLATGWDAK